MRLGIVKPGGQRAALRIALPVCEFGLKNAGGAGADKHADALSAIALRRRRDGLRKAILREAELSQPVVAAVEVAQIGTHRLVIDAFNFADPGVQRRALEAARYEPAALLA